MTKHKKDDEFFLIPQGAFGELTDKRYYKLMAAIQSAAYPDEVFVLQEIDIIEQWLADWGTNMDDIICMLIDRNYTEGAFGDNRTFFSTDFGKEVPEDYVDGRGNVR